MQELDLHRLRSLPSMVGRSRRMVAALFLGLMLFAQGCGEPMRPPPNFVFILIDTLRADFLSSYGYPDSNTPMLDTLASQGLAFERVVAPSSWTKTSMASIFTARDPARHGVRRPEHVLPSAQETLAEKLRRSGYHTVGVVANLWLLPRFGFNRGFDIYQPMAFSTTAHELNRRALRVMRERPEKPFFLYLHYTDVHAPYHPSPEYFDEAPLEIDGMGVVSNYDLEKMYRQMEIDSPEIEARVRAMYAATVREMDAAIGWLMTALRKRKLLNNTVVVVTSDHGESFREHGTTRHGYNVYPEVVDVPLIVWSPTFPLPKGRVKEQVRSIDIAPTLLDLAGIETPANYDGRSLLPADSAPLKTRTATSVVGQHSKLPDRDVIAIRSDQHLYIHERREDLVEFYELTGDPGALKNLGRDHPRVPDYASLEPSTSSEEPAQVQLDEKLQEMLRAVGYLEEN